MRIVVTGGTGFIGQALVPFLLQQGHTITVLTRQTGLVKTASVPGLDYVESLDTINNDDQVDVIINLAGHPIADRRWSNSQKNRLVQSRTMVTDSVIALIQRLNTRPECLISASAVGYYGAQGEKKLDENSSPNDEFSHQLCRNWEETALQARDPGTRVCIIRLGIVLGPDGGVLGRMLPGFRMGLGGVLGSGNQYMSWISRDDTISIIHFLIQKPELEGVFNVTAPNPVTNAEFTRNLGQVLSRPTFMTMPGTVVKLLFGEMGDRLLLHGQRVIPQRLLDSGFEFSCTQLEQALHKSIDPLSKLGFLQFINRKMR